MSRRSPVSRRSSSTAWSGSDPWAPRNRLALRCIRCPGTSPVPASTRLRWASRCASCSITPAGSVPGTGSNSGLPAGRRRRCSPTSTSTWRWTTRAWGRPAPCWGPRRWRSSTKPRAWCARCGAGPSSTSTSHAANARRAGKAPSGWIRSTSGWKPVRAPTRTSASSRTLPTPYSESRSARWAMVQPARWHRRSRSSATNTSRTSREADARSTPETPCSLHPERPDAPMTSLSDAAKPQTGDGVTRPDMVTLTIDGNEISVPKGTLVIRAAELIGIQIPRFCDHPLLDPVGACRQCLVEVEGQRKPLASCTTVATDEMVVRTQLTSEAADKAQHGVMELLLINHPLDCPMCDKGGECPLQNQAMSNGRADSRFTDVKRTFAKPINISSQVLLDRERCILCARCTRFSEQIAGDPFIDMQERGALQQVGIYANEPFESYFSGNTVQICPVGALTGTAYRFRARPFDLVSSPSVCEHCAGGCAERTDHRRGKVLRRLAGDDPEVNEEWNCDKGRWAFRYTTQPDVITTPLIRDADGELEPASWSHAIAIAIAGLEKARGRTGVLVGGRVTWEDAYAYSKFARIVLDTNDIDFRARPHSVEEADFLAARVAGRPLTVSYSDLESAPVVLLVDLEAEEEAPIVFLRLRKAARKHSVPVYSIAPFATRALGKMSGRLIQTVPGAEPSTLDGLATGGVGDLLATPGAVIMVGERLATVPGGLS